MDLGYVSSSLCEDGVYVISPRRWWIKIFPSATAVSRLPVCCGIYPCIVMGRARMYIPDEMGVAEEEADDMNWRAVLSSSFLHFETVRQ
jgi:hypothetical protein